MQFMAVLLLTRTINQQNNLRYWLIRDKVFVPDRNVSIINLFDICVLMYFFYTNRFSNSIEDHMDIDKFVFLVFCKHEIRTK